MDVPFLRSTTLFPDGFFMQKHRPVPMESMHNHNHVEVIFPDQCDLDFITHAGTAKARSGHLCLLWGQLPHRVTHCSGQGHVYVANLPLQELLSLGLADEVTGYLLSGHLVTTQQAMSGDDASFERWLTDYMSDNPALLELARTELQCRLRRQNNMGWAGTNEANALAAGTSKGRHLKRMHLMIRFMAEHYTQPISVSDIAGAGGVSDGYAMGLFQKAFGTSITSYLTKLRIYHAKSALIETDEKILTIALDSGFGSLSRFYEVFSQDAGQTPQNYRRAAR